MSYRLALVRRWSRRDRLAVLVVAVGVAFLTGAALLGAAATDEFTGVAADYGSPASATTYDSPAAARAAAPPDSLVLELARADAPGGTVTVVGVPEGASAFADATGVALPARPPPGEVRAPSEAARRSDAEAVRLDGTEGTERVAVEPRESRSVLPPRWYVAHSEDVEDAGATEALVLSPVDGPAGSGPATAPGSSADIADGAHLRGVLAFFVLGARTVMEAAGLVVAGAAVLLGVTVFSATRIAVRDRRRTIQVARATGATRRTLLAVFGVRAGLQTAVGVALGYALGVIAPNLAVNATVFAGHETSLSVRVTPEVAGPLLATYVGLVGVGAAGGVLAARPTVVRPPGAPATPGPRRGRLARYLPDALVPTLLDRRAFVPTAATLTVFVTLAVLLASTYGVVAPLAGGGGTTVTEPGAEHPFASSVPASYADELRAEGTPASAELLLLEASGDQPYLARGASFPAFANVTDAAVADGRRPDSPREVVAGVDLLRTLDADVGDRLVIGGSTETAVERVRIVGAFRAPEPFDDQLVVPLSTAGRLTAKSGDDVHLVRTADSPPVDSSTGVEVVAVEAPDRVPADATVAVNATVANPSPDDSERAVTASLGDASRGETVELAPGERRTVGFDLPTGSARTATLSVGDRTREVEVLPSDALVVSGLPARAPPDSRPRVGVETVGGDPVADAAVEVGDASVRTDESGAARLPLDELDRPNGTRSYRVTASDGDESASADLTVDPDAERRLAVSVSVSPESATVTSRPEARVVASNPWNATVERSLTVVGPGTEATERASLAPGERTTLAAELGQRPPGTYEVEALADGDRVATAAYRVGGDPRLGAALASSGARGPTTGIGRALSVVLGNVGLVFGTLLALAGLMTVGGTVAGFASAVAARRPTVGVHRSMGATRWAVVRLVVRDALLVGTAATATATVLAGIALRLLDASGLLTVYGVRLLPTVDPLVVVASGAAALLIALAGAGLAALRLVATPPAELLSGDGADPVGPVGGVGDFPDGDEAAGLEDGDATRADAGGGADD